MGTSKPVILTVRLNGSDRSHLVIESIENRFIHRVAICDGSVGLEAFFR